ncbi:MAG: Fic family protein [Acidobacteria bacterium]|nr:Fic family protein [Acidobacteriota bacterium]MCZ6878863.1 Fic family protein [Acidobacteriota bacterium]
MDKQAADLRSLIHKELAPQLIEYELGKVSHQVPQLDESEVPRSQAAAMFSAVLGLDKALEELDSSDLFHLYDWVGADQRNPYRQTPSQPLTSTHEPVEAALVPRAVDRFFEWVRSPSFADLHAIQQMSLSQMRLYEIHPFPKYSQLTVSLFSYYFLLKADYLVPLYEVGELAKFYQALGQAFMLSSEALVHFNLQACQRAYEHVLSRISHSG